MDKKSRFSKKDRIVILLSLASVLVLGYIMWDSSRKQQQEQEMLQEISEEQSTADAKQKDLTQLAEGLYINEINQAGWIELYNGLSRDEIPLQDCKITVNGQVKKEFTKEEVLPAAGYLCVENLGSLAAGDVISIFLPEEVLHSSMLVPDLESGESYGRITDGAEAMEWMTATKGESNTQGEVVETEKLHFSVPGGFYDNDIQVELSAGENSRIYYTLDGSEPTTQSALYEGPITIINRSGSDMTLAVNPQMEYYTATFQPASITMGTVLKAIAVDTLGQQSDTVTQSYFIGIEKSGDITGVPVISISTDENNLFDYFEGIYVKGRSYEDEIAKGYDGGGAGNYYNNWSKPVYVEFFSNQKDKTFAQKMQVSIINDISTTWPQKGLKLTGENCASEGTGLERYYREGENGFSLLTHRRDNTFMLREYLAQRLLDATTVRTQNMESCAVFLNGEYWGIYMLRGNYDADFIAEEYGVAAGDVLFARNGVTDPVTENITTFGKLYDFVTTRDMSDIQNYEQVKEMMDVENYLQYFCANLYLANAFYGEDTVITWRTISENGTGFGDGRWRFLMCRLDNSMGNKATGGKTTATIDSYLMESVSQDIFFRALLHNEEFRNSLSSVMQEMAEHTFADEKVEAVLGQLAAEKKKIVLSNYKRFRGNIEDTVYHQEVKKIEEFFRERESYILRYTQEVAEGTVNWDAEIPQEQTAAEEGTENLNE